MEKKHKLLTFYVKCLVISLPVLLLVAFYAYKDPFMVLRSYADYDHSWVVQDEGAVAWEIILRAVLSAFSAMQKAWETSV